MNDSNDNVPVFESLPTKDKILIAAREEFVRCGFEGARVQRIAEVSGANKAMIYYYFGGKSDLYLRVLETVVSTALEGLAGIVASPGQPSTEILRNVVRFYVELYSKNTDFLRLVMREFANRGKSLDRIIERLEQVTRNKDFPRLLWELLIQGAKSGEFRDVDPRQTVMSLISMCAGYFMLQPFADVFMGIRDDPPVREEFLERRADEVAELLLSGIVAKEKKD